MEKKRNEIRSYDTIYMKDPTLVDQDKLIRAIQRGGEQKKAALAEIYNALNLEEDIRIKITKTRENDDAHRELYHDAFLIFVKKIKDGDVDQHTPFRAYVYSIAKWEWANKYRKTKKEISSMKVDSEDKAMESVENQYIKQELKEKLDDLLLKLKEKCKRILTLWKLGYSFKEIAEEMELESEYIARKLKYRCYKNLIKQIRKIDDLKKYINE